MQLFCPVFQILCLSIILLNAISQFVHAAGVGTSPHVSQLTAFQRVLQGMAHVLGDPRCPLQIYRTQVEAAGSKIAITAFCVIVSSNNRVRLIIVGSPVVGQQPGAVTRICWLLPSFLTWLHERFVGSFQIWVESTCQPRTKTLLWGCVKRAGSFLLCKMLPTGNTASITSDTTVKI